MARIRSIKPDFWTDGNMTGLSFAARLFYIGTWNFSLCDRGHLSDDPVGLKLKILPADDVDAHLLLAELLAAGRLVRRRSQGGRTYLFNPRLVDHQKVDVRWQSKCPHCSSEADGGFTEESVNLPETPASPTEPPETPPSSPQDRKGWDGIGEDGIGVPPTAGNSLALARGDTATPEPSPATTDALIAEWIEHCRKRPPGNVIGQVGKQIKAMLAEGIDPSDVRAGLAAWWRKGVHPSVLPSIVNEVMNSSPAGPARASPRLIEHNGLRLKPETVANLEGRARWEAIDQLAIEGTAS